jgi:hypothetical protein
MVSDLLLAIREVDETIHLQGEIDLLSSPIVTEKTLVHLGFNAARLQSQKFQKFDYLSAAIIWRQGF